jgi:hypothetical protein
VQNSYKNVEKYNKSVEEIRKKPREDFSNPHYDLQISLRIFSMNFLALTVDKVV